MFRAIIVASTLVVASLPAALVAVPPSTPTRATSSTGVAAPAVVAAKVPTRFTTRAAGRRVVRRHARPVRLEHKVDGRWRSERRKRSSRRGRVAFRVATPTVAERYRTVAPRHTVRVRFRSKGRVVSRRVSLPAWVGPVTTLRGPTVTPSGTPWVTGYYAGWFWDVDVSARAGGHASDDPLRLRSRGAGRWLARGRAGQSHLP